MNELHLASSPYLLQHAHNPVHWKEWSKTIIEQAIQENKPLLISIGYASCHWCHVMEKESFENEDTAAIMNNYFICVKVDREERPDIDSYFMDICQLMTGGGGWPLNVFCLPDGRPIHATTYLPAKNWNQLLFHINNLHQDPNQSDKVEEYARKISNAIMNMQTPPKGSNKYPLDNQFLVEAMQKLLNQTDSEKGGMNRAPKFPLFATWEQLFLIGKATKMENCISQAHVSTLRMSNGGIYDHLQGGISRYATDIDWKIPHFEKMLYDNAQYLGLLAVAYNNNQAVHYLEKAQQTFSFLTQELLSPEGIYYGALDADSEGEEGKYYVWKYSEIIQIKHPSIEHFCEYYHLTEAGNFEHGNNILHATQTKENFAKSNNIDELSFKQGAYQIEAILLQKRLQRIKPSLDDNRILSWNALLLAGLSKAGFFMTHADFITEANKLYKQIKEHFFDEKWYRINEQKKGKKIEALAEDYAYLIDALYWCYLLDYDSDKLILANELLSQSIALFYDEQSEYFMNASVHSEDIPLRKAETGDDVTPSINAIFCSSLRRLGHYFSNTIYLNLSEKLLGNMSEKATEHPAWHMVWLGEMNAVLHRNQSLIAAHVDLENEQAKELFFTAEILGKTTNKSKNIPLVNHQNPGYYLCKNNACQAPVQKLEDLKITIT